jgi:hypothetical protein
MSAIQRDAGERLQNQRVSFVTQTRSFLLILGISGNIIRSVLPNAFRDPTAQRRAVANGAEP